MSAKNKYLLFPTALFLFLVIPHLYRWGMLGRNYTTLLLDGQGTTQTAFEETNAYASLANRIRFGQPINDPYTFEYRRLPSPFLSEWLPAVVLGYIAIFSGLPLVMVLIKVLGPLFLVFLFGKISRQAGYFPNLSLVAGITAVFMPKLFALMPYPTVLSYLFSSELEFQRLFHPLFSWIIVALFIVFLQNILSSQSKYLKIIMAGILLGLLFYTYIFAWTWVWFAMAVLAVTMILKKEFKFLKKLIAITFIGAIIGLPYFQNFIKFTGTTSSQDFITRTVMPVRQSHLLVIIRYVALCLFLIFLDRQWINKIQLRILLILLGTAILLPDLSQLLLGYNLEVDHWIVRFLYPLSTLLFILGLGNWFLHRFKTHGKIILLGLLSMVFARLFTTVIFELKRPVFAFQLGKERQGLYAWMNKNIPQNSVVGSLSFTEETYLAAYTPFYPYLPRGDRTLATTEEVLRRYIFISQQLGVSTDYLDRTLSIPPEKVPLLSGIPAMDQNAIAPLFSIRFLYDREAQYRERLALRERAKTMLFDKLPLIGRLDYILIGPTERMFSHKNLDSCCRLVYENNEYKLYRYSTSFTQ